MKKLILKNISKETQLVRASASANKEELKAGKSLEVEDAVAKQYAKAYPEIFIIEEKGETTFEDVKIFLQKIATDEEKNELLEALTGEEKEKTKE